MGRSSMKLVLLCGVALAVAAYAAPLPGMPDGVELHSMSAPKSYGTPAAAEVSDTSSADLDKANEKAREAETQAKNAEAQAKEAEQVSAQEEKDKSALEKANGDQEKDQQVAKT